MKPLSLIPIQRSGSVSRNGDVGLGSLLSDRCTIVLSGWFCVRVRHSVHETKPTCSVFWNYIRQLKVLKGFCLENTASNQRHRDTYEHGMNRMTEDTFSTVNWLHKLRHAYGGSFPQTKHCHPEDWITKRTSPVFSIRSHDLWVGPKDGTRHSTGPSKHKFVWVYHTYQDVAIESVDRNDSPSVASYAHCSYGIIPLRKPFPWRCQAQRWVWRRRICNENVSRISRSDVRSHPDMCDIVKRMHGLTCSIVPSDRVHS